MKKLHTITALAALAAALAQTGCVVQTRHGVVYAAPRRSWVADVRIRAVNGDPAAQYTLASCYDTGRGVPLAPAEAARWYQASASQGYVPAEYRLGACYATGRGVPLNPPEAVRWYRLAAQQGNGPAELSLAGCLYRGFGTPRDLGEAATWYRRAAAHPGTTGQQGLYWAQVCEAQLGGRPAPAAPAGMAPTAAPTAAPAQAESPLSVDEVKGLSASGVKAEAIIEEIKKSNAKFSAQDIAGLQEAKVDQAVLDYIRSNAAQ